MLKFALRRVKTSASCQTYRGPNQWDSLSSQGCPTWDELISKEQLVVINQAGKREYTAVARARASMKRVKMAATMTSMDELMR